MVFSAKSFERLETCHPDLQRLFKEVVKHYDCAVLCGQRTEEEQNDAFLSGKSQTPWPSSKHNSYPSLAVDVVPYPVDWNDLSRFYHFAGFVNATAIALGIAVRWGGDWNGDMRFREEKFKDLPHWELING